LSTERLDEIILRLQAALSRLRSDALSDEDAASILEECAEIASEASGELERRFYRSAASRQGVTRAAYQDTLL
jgi:hypothetical protein